MDLGGKVLTLLNNFLCSENSTRTMSLEIGLILLKEKLIGKSQYLAYHIRKTVQGLLKGLSLYTGVTPSGCS